MDALQGDGRSSRRLFLLLAILTAAVHVVLLADHRLPRHHRTRERVEMQFALLSLCAQPGQIPLWLPPGVASHPALLAHSGLLEAPLLLTGRATTGVPVALLFHLGVLAEELLFLSGVWLLSRRFFRSPLAAFFTGASALASGFWLDDVELNLHSIAALPLVLELLHRFLDRGSRGALFLAGNLMALQMLGAAAGTGLVCPIAAGIYFVGRRWVLKEPLPRLDWKPLTAGLSVLLPVFALFMGSGGQASRPMTLLHPLVYSGLSNPLRYVDFLLGMTPSLDWTLYAGALSVGMALVALRSIPRDRLVRLMTGIPVALLLLGASLFLVHAAVPLLRPERPLPYGTPLLRLFVVFLAGAGFQNALESRDSRALRFAGTILAGAALGMAMLGSLSAISPETTGPLLALPESGEAPAALHSAVFEPAVLPGALKSSLVSDLLGASALFAGLGGGLLLLLGGSPRSRPYALALLLIVHPLDAFGWKCRMSWLESLPTPPAQRERLRIRPDAANPGAVPQNLAPADPAPGVPLEAGIPPVESPSSSPLRSVAGFLLGLNQLFWLFWMLRTVARLSLRGSLDP